MAAGRKGKAGADAGAGVWQNGLMNQVRCPECHALNVTIVNSDEARGLVTVQCFE